MYPIKGIERDEKTADEFLLKAYPIKGIESLL